MPDRRPRLRQVGVITRDNDAVEGDLVAIFGVSLASRYPGVDEFGLGTAFFPLGNEIFEVVLAVTPGTVAQRFIDRRGGDGGFIVMLECAELPRYRQRIEAAGLRVVVEGVTPHARFVQIHPHDTAGTFLELREELGPGAGTVDGPWTYAGPEWRAARRTQRVRGIVGATVRATAPVEAATLWSRILGLDTIDTTVHLRGAVLRFAQAEHPSEVGLWGIDVAVADRTAVMEAAERRGRLDGGLITIGGLRICLDGDD